MATPAEKDATPAPIASHLKDNIRPSLVVGNTPRRATALGVAPGI
jgi:hypothetical protein